MKPIFCKNEKRSDNIAQLISRGLTLDYSVFRDVLAYGFILGNKTPFREIKREHKIMINMEDCLTDAEKIKSLFIAHLRESISRAVGKESKRVGLFLSGGIDSTSLAIMLGNYFKDLEIHTYTASFRGNEDEAEKARQISEKYNFYHHNVVIDNNDFNKWEAVIKAIGMPIADEASIPLFKLSERACQDRVGKVLMGDGNDELWCGYDEYYRLKRMKQKIPYCLPRLGIFLRELDIPKARGLGRLLQHRDWKELIKANNSFDLKETLLHCWLEQRYGIVKCFGISPKFPFLSKELVRLACNVPLLLKFRGANKWLVKEAVARVDKIILERSKKLMGFPKRAMFEANKNKIKQVVRDSKIVDYSPFDNYIAVHRKFIIALWHNIFVQGA